MFFNLFRTTLLLDLIFFGLLVSGTDFVGPADHKQFMGGPSFFRTCFMFRGAKKCAADVDRRALLLLLMCQLGVLHATHATRRHAKQSNSPKRMRTCLRIFVCARKASLDRPLSARAFVRWRDASWALRCLHGCSFAPWLDASRASHFCGALLSPTKQHEDDWLARRAGEKRCSACGKAATRQFGMSEFARGEMAASKH